MQSPSSRGSGTPGLSADALGADDGQIRSENEVDYLQLSIEATDRVQHLISSDSDRGSSSTLGVTSTSFRLNEVQCRLLADALSEAVQAAQKDTRGLDAASVRLFTPSFRELCRVAGDCEKLVRDCCQENWLAVTILLADSKEDFFLRVSELKWCVKAWRTVIQHGLQGGAWLREFHKFSTKSVADRRTAMHEYAARLTSAAEEDFLALLAKLREVRGHVDVEKAVRDVASYVLSRCEMLSSLPANEQTLRSEYDLQGSGIGTIRHRLIGKGAVGDIFRSSWHGENFACKVYFKRNDFDFEQEVVVMTKIGSHPRTVRFLGVERTPHEISIVMELTHGDLSHMTGLRSRAEKGRSSNGDRPFPLHVAVDVLLQVAEAVECVHKHQLFHRDLKSSNILVQPVEMQALRDEGYLRAKLSDFTATEARSPAFTTRVGTRLWMAPEILKRELDETLVYGAKADAYSFAIVCFEVFSGKVPLEGLFGHDLAEYVREGGRPELPATLPSHLASLVQRCWDRDPTQRPTFTSITKELRYLKFLITIGGDRQFRALDVPDADAEATAKIVKNLRWIDPKNLHLIRHIGSGGYGSVDECELESAGRVAVKNLLRCSSKVRVEEESALLVRVQHRNVVKLVGCAWNEQRKGMIVMELMDQDLHHLISDLKEASPNEPPFSLGVALGIMLKVASAMRHIRSCHVLHRDLKTTNILVKSRTVSQSSLFQKLMRWLSRSSDAARYDVKLADFGLAKYKLQDSSFTTKASEAQLWRAPETSEARNYSWPADVFSFGVVCYEILSGEVPFQGVHGAELLRLVRSGERPQIPTYCPADLAELVAACWATDPTSRPDFAEICVSLWKKEKYKRSISWSDHGSGVYLQTRVEKWKTCESHLFITIHFPDLHGARRLVMHGVVDNCEERIGEIEVPHACAFFRGSQEFVVLEYGTVRVPLP